MGKLYEKLLVPYIMINNTYQQCCNSYSLFVTSYSYSYITKNITSYRYKLQTPKCN